MPRAALTQEEIETTRKHMCEIALDICRTDGIEGLSLRNLGKRLGMSRMAAYRYFTSRDELVASMRGMLIHECVDQAEEDLELINDSKAKIIASIKSMYRFAKERQNEFRFSFIEHADSEAQDPVYEAKQRLLKFNADLCQQAIDDGVLQGNALTQAHIMSFVFYGMGSLNGYPMVYGVTLDELLDTIIKQLFPAV